MSGVNVLAVLDHALHLQATVVADEVYADTTAADVDRMREACAAVTELAAAAQHLLSAASASAAHGKPFAIDSPGILDIRAALAPFKEHP